MVGVRIDVERELARRIPSVARRLRMFANEAVSSLDLSDATGWALLQVHRSGTEASQSRLAAALQISGPSLVRLLNQLEGRGLIRRMVDEGDRRPNRVELTADGISAAERIEAVLVPVRADLFRGISDEDLDVATALLVRLDERLHDWSKGRS